MKEETKLTLDKLMDKYQQKLAAAKMNQEKIRSEEDVLQSAFKQLEKEVIRPVMEDFGKQLKARGHEYQITEEEESLDREGKLRDASITMHIFPAGINRSAFRQENTPSISFIASRNKKKVLVHASNILPNRGGSAGARGGDLMVEEVTSDLVEQEILGVLNDIFAPRY